MIAAEDEQHLVGLEVLPMQLGLARAGGVLVLLGDRHVDPPAQQERQRRLGLLFGELDPQRRMLGGEALERRHHQRARRLSPALERRRYAVAVNGAVGVVLVVLGAGLALGR